MPDNEDPKYAFLLKLQYAFQDLDEAQLAHLVSRLERVDVPKDQVIISEGEAGEYFYIIYSGEARVTRKVGEAEHPWMVLEAGDYFGDEALLSDRPSTLRVTAFTEPVSLLRLSREDFSALIRDMPSVEAALNATLQSRRLAETRNFDWLGEKEVIYLIARKHSFFLILSLILPAILAVVGTVGLGLGSSQSVGGFGNLFLVLGTLILVAGIALAIWNWVDWGNDFYILTNRRVVWLEKVVFLYFSRREAPLTQILARDVRSSFLGRILNYGTIEVRTYTGKIVMQHADNPYRFQSFIEAFEQRAKEHIKRSEEAKMEQSLRQRLGLDTPAVPAPAKPAAEAAATPTPTKVGVVRQFMNTFLEIRYEQDGIITYRKHWLILIKQTILPTLAFLSFTALVIFLVAKDILTGLPIFMIYMLVYIVIVAWWLYNFVNWINDIYQVTPDQVLDIEKRPLGQEIKKTASLDSIISIEHDRIGIFQIIFNYGFVKIMVGQTPFIFHYVKNPDQVQQDIAFYIEARRRKKLDQEEALERERMLDWLSTYRNQSGAKEEIEKKTDWDLFPG